MNKATEKISQIEALLGELPPNIHELLEHAKERAIGNPEFRQNALHMTNSAVISALAQKATGDVKAVAEMCCELATMVLTDDDHPS